MCRCQRITLIVLIAAALVSLPTFSNYICVLAQDCLAKSTPAAIEYLINRYQVMLTGLLAVLAAFLTIRTMNKQTQEERDRYSEERKRKTFAMRSHIPAAAKELAIYTNHSFRFIRDAEGICPRPPSEAVIILNACIEHVDSQSSEALFELVSFIQIHDSRLSDYSQHSRHSRAVQTLYDSVRLNYLVERMFEYGRNRADCIPVHEPTLDEMMNSLKSLVGPGEYYSTKERYADLEQYIRSLHPDTPMP